MAYRNPVATVVLFKNVPLDPHYLHTIRFNSKQLQFDTFMATANFPHTQFSGYLYQRKNRGYIRCQGYAENFQDYNYVMFCNEAVNVSSTIPNTKRLYYAFIDSIDYINDNTFEITYTIDVLQTYMFDYKLGYCFVEREHSETDELYEHLEAEKFNPNDFNYSIAGNYNNSSYYIMIKYVPNQVIITDWYFVGSTKSILFNTQGSARPRGWIFNKTYSGVCCVSFPFDCSTDSATEYTAANVDGCLSTLGGTTEITEISILPSSLCPHNTSLDEYNTVHYWEFYQNRIPDGRTYSTSETKSISQLTAFTDAKGNSYTPINKKLYSSPYNLLFVTNEQGDSKEILWENFTNTNATFSLDGVRFGVAELALIPTNYNGKTKALENSVSLQNFPTCSFSFDTALTYWQQNKAQITSNIIKNALLFIGGISLPSMAVSLPAMSSAGALQASTVSPFLQDIISDIPKDITPLASEISYSRGGLSAAGKLGGMGLTSQIASLIDLKAAPDKVQGSQTYSQIPVLNGSFGLKVYYKTIKPYEAKIIDDYFTMFGYAVKRVKIPNLFDPAVHIRPSYNYLKTAYTHLEGYKDTPTSVARCVPNSVEEEIRAIYERGITVWNYWYDVGNYEADNSPYFPT